jgi:hypothetical protein
VSDHENGTDSDSIPGEGGGWINIGQIHTVPEDEIKIHSMSPSCACGPKIMHEEMVLQIVHNSYDAREINERAGAGVLKLIRED